MRTSRPLAALVAAAVATVLVAGLTSVPAQAASRHDPKPGRIGAAWLKGELTNGLVHNDEFAFDDLGLSIDFALGLDGARRKPRVVQRITNAVAPRVTEYTSFDTSVFAGQVAKAAVLALVAGRDPRSFGGIDLITQLEGLVSTTPPITGRIEDDSEFGDLANVIGQLHAVRALSLAKSPRAAQTLSFLLKQQCNRGFFRETFTVDKTRADQSCQGAPAVERRPSTDTTALAVLALLDVRGAKARRAVDNAVDWLVGHQRRNGSLSSDGKRRTAANANSTGLAGWALGAAGARRYAERAAIWVRNLEVPGVNPCARKLRRDVGGVAYDGSTYRKGQRQGITVPMTDQWRRASAQAIPALRWAVRAKTRFSVSAPRVVGAGDRLRITVRGAAPGERICVSGPSVTEFQGKTTARTHVIVKAADKPGRRTYKVWLGGRKRQVTVRIVG